MPEFAPMQPERSITIHFLRQNRLHPNCFKASAESITRHMGCCTAKIAMRVFRDHIDMRGILERLLGRICRRQRKESSFRFEHSPDFLHDFYEREADLVVCIIDSLAGDM